jgi:dTDP-4-amino-4,6-dideoxygalactose transaminase
MNPFKVVSMFEEAMAEYCGSPYAVAVDNCTDALFLCCKYMEVEAVNIPSRTYLSVPQSIIHAGGDVIFDTRMNNWKGIYQLWPYPIYDAAKRLTSGMYIPGTMMCLSFHIKKILPIGKGGMILTDDIKALMWFRTARYEGRSEKPYKDDNINSLGWNMYLTPEQAARGLYLLSVLPEHNEDLEEVYKDLTDFPVFKNHTKI